MLSLLGPRTGADAGEVWNEPAAPRLVPDQGVAAELS